MNDRQFICRTQYSDRHYYRKFVDEPLTELSFFVEYVLWECSTEFMVASGMPTDDDVLCWINWIDRRPDGKTPLALQIISDCERYLK